MDYGKLTKPQLIKLCEKREISFSSSWTKLQLEEALIEDDKLLKAHKLNREVAEVQARKNTGTKLDPNAGGLVTLIFAYFAVVPAGISGVVMLFLWPSFGVFLLLAMSPGLILGIFAIRQNTIWRRTGKAKLSAGILGLFFGLIGGILVLVAEQPKIEEEPEKPKRLDPSGGARYTVVIAFLGLLVMVTILTITLVSILTWAPDPDYDLEYQQREWGTLLAFSSIMIPLIIDCILAIVFNIIYIKTDRFKVVAGITGIFTSVFGGVLVLMAKKADPEFVEEQIENRRIAKNK